MSTHEAPLLWSLREAEFYIMAAIEQAADIPNRDAVEVELRLAFNHTTRAIIRAKVGTR